MLLAWKGQSSNKDKATNNRSDLNDLVVGNLYTIVFEQQQKIQRNFCYRADELCSNVITRKEPSITFDDRSHVDPRVWPWSCARRSNMM